MLPRPGICRAVNRQPLSRSTKPCARAVCRRRTTATAYTFCLDAMYAPAAVRPGRRKAGLPLHAFNGSGEAGAMGTRRRPQPRPLVSDIIERDQSQPMRNGAISRRVFDGVPMPMPAFLLTRCSQNGYASVVRLETLAEFAALPWRFSSLRNRPRLAASTDDPVRGFRCAGRRAK